MKKLKCELSIPFNSPSSAKKAYDSLIQETEFKRRSTAQLKISGSELLLSISSDELAPFRATLNSYLRLLNVYFSSEKVVQH